MMKNVFRDFDIFSRALVASKDHDPVYPFIKEYFKLKGMNDYDDQAWFLFVYVNFYSLESAIKMTNEIPINDWNPKRFREMRLDGELKKFGIERRGTARNIDNQILMFNEIRDYIQYSVEAIESPTAFRNQIADTIPFYGGWSAYKLCELYSEVIDVNTLKLNDLGLAGRDPNRDDSPVGGLRWLYGRDRKYDKSAFDTWEELGKSLATEYNMDVANIETCLCKFHKLASGKYYIGHDIHELCELREFMGESNFKKVMRPFDPHIWYSAHGVEKGLKKVYIEEGQVFFSEFAHDFPMTNVEHWVQDIYPIL